MRNLLPLLLLAAALPIRGATVTLSPNVQENDEIEAVYQGVDNDFARLDASAVGKLYSKDSLYLGPSGDMLHGRDAIVKAFAKSFDDMRTGHGTISIAFKVVDRRASGDLVADTGYFTITRTYSNKSNTARGKYVNVFEKDRAGNWHLHIDMYAPAP